jgi:hypothetical protein
MRPRASDEPWTAVAHALLATLLLDIGEICTRFARWIARQL